MEEHATANTEVGRHDTADRTPNGPPRRCPRPPLHRAQVLLGGAPTPLVWLEHHGIDFTAVLALTGVAIALTVALHPPVSRLPRRLLLVPAWAGAPLIVYGLLTALLAPFDHSPGAGPITGWIVPAGAAAFVGIGTALTLGAWPHRASRPTATARRSPGMPG